MTVELADTGSRIHQSRIKMEYNWWVGAVGSRFYRGLRDEGRIWGLKCPECSKVFVPPKIKCIDCYEDLHDWLELPGTGTVETYTIVRYEEPVLHPRKAPFAYGVIMMDGADTGLVHFIGDVDPEEVKVGMRVEAVFEDEREGNILDIKHFRPIA